MALPVNRPHTEVVTAVATLADLATASSTYAVATHRGRLKRAFSIIQNAITTANAAVSVKISKMLGDGTYSSAVTVGTITIATSGSAAGDVDSVNLGYQGTANFVGPGDLITFTTDGAADTTCITRFYAVIERAN